MTSLKLTRTVYADYGPYWVEKLIGMRNKKSYVNHVVKSKTGASLFSSCDAEIAKDIAWTLAKAREERLDDNAQN